MITDKQRIDHLQRLLNEKEFTGKVVLRKSTTGRGWRLHETELPGAVSSVRRAIDNDINRTRR